MQGAYLTVTIGIEFFLLVGYLFYVLFRTYAEEDGKVSMMKWVMGLIAFLTFWLIVSVVLVALEMSTADLVLASAILIVDLIGLYLLFDDTRRLSQSLLVKQT
ncbi:MAG: hypothetical protein ACFFBJ_09950 [Promethearchaeota archaeon]